MTTHISIAYSPDTDDQFMILALRERHIPWGSFTFEFVVDDIQNLNTAALDQTYDITAISVGAYPSLIQSYLLMSMGASIGDEFGPAVVTRPESHVTGIQQLKGKRIAVPGLNTSAHMASQALFGPFEAVPMYFMDIGSAVLKGEVDAGILIHELQMNPESQGLKKLTDLGRLWFDRFQLPLPLGANAIRRSLGMDTIGELGQIYRKSIEYGLASRSISIAKAVQSAAAKETLNQTLGEKYISMYVNERSLKLQEDTLRGIETLFEMGAQCGLIDRVDLSSLVAPG
ncbi:MAG: ABC transporter substrate-binding protein [Proteobacteria bacterium]|nr:ABC transporter substrate-binding protein [Pseudomonadota bacterium]